MIDLTSRQKEQWYDLGIVCGIGASIAYALGVFIPVPLRPGYLAFSAFGPLLIVACLGLYVILREHRNTVSLQIAILFLVGAGILITAMATMQGSIIFQIRDLAAGADESGRQTWRDIYRATMSTQLGLDFAWDIFISTGTFLLAWNLVSHPRFWRIFGGAGMLVAAAGLTVNSITFPENSGEAGLVDPAPFFGVWYGVLVVLVIANRSWFRREVTRTGS